MKFLAAPEFLVTICCLATPCTAAEITRYTEADKTIIFITGEILPNDDEKFIKLAYGPNIIVKLNSKGGWNKPAALMGHHIRKMNYETRLEKGDICNSACTLIFLAGTYRHMDPGTRLGFHTTYSEDGKKRRDDESNKKIAAYLAWAGAPQQIIDLQPKADPCCLNYVSSDWAKKWGALKERPRQVVTGTDLDGLLERARLFRAANGL
jgi:hypothetical protein